MTISKKNIGSLWLSLLLPAWSLVAAPNPEACIIDTDQTISYFDVATHNRILPDTATAFEPQLITFTPDASKAVVFCNGHDTSQLTFVDLDAQENRQSLFLNGRSITSLGFGHLMAVKPDGSELWLVDSLYGNDSIFIVDPVTATLKNTVLPNTVFGSQLSFSCIAFTPDGKEAWLGEQTQSSIFIIDVATLSVKARIPYGTGTISSIAMTPDNKKALLCNALLNVTVVDIASKTIETTIPALGDDVLTSPDNSFACTYDRNTGLTIINLPSLTIRGSVVVGSPAGVLGCAIAITPNSKEIWILGADSSAVQTCFIVDPSLLVVKSTFPVPSSYGVLSISPDQAPTAQFSSTTQGLVLNVDGSSSTSPAGTVALYTWDFGDGSPGETNPFPTASHTYIKSGGYPVTLTVTNSAGTSTKKIYTGALVTNNGGPTAEHTEQIAIEQPLPPSKFVGKVKVEDGKVFVNTTWKKSSSPHVAKYEIFVDKHLVASVSAKDDLEKTISLPGLNVPVEIRTISANGLSSDLVRLKIVK